MNLFRYINSRFITILNKLRLIKMKLLGAKIGKNVRVFGKFSVIGNLSNLTIGANSTINEGVHLNLRDKITIGENVRLSSFVQLHTGKLTMSGIPRKHVKKPIIIEDNVWLASSVIVSAGVKIGKNSVVGAGGVVIGSIAEDCFYAGNPAKMIRNLNVSGKGSGSH
jgi:acetyltransferase-like isoleucine patch superfamily enzyme